MIIDHKPEGSIYFVLALLLIPIIANMAEEKKGEVLSVVEANGLFAKQLYKVLSKEQGNIFFSPISAHAVLSMAYQGSQKDTYAAFTKVLNTPNHDVAATGYQNMLKKLNNVSGVELLMANKIYLQNGANLNADFKQTVENKFQSAIEQTNFADSETASKLINNWVEEKTKNKIKNLISPGDLNDSTRLVLINAIYFKGNWASKFNSLLTTTEPFYLDDSNTINVQMMKQTGKYNYKEDEYLDAKILEIPYSNKDFSLIIILPNERNGIRKLEEKIANLNLVRITDGMYNSDVYLQLPKFKIETKIDLENSLTELGLGVIFKDEADFTNMLDPSEPLVVSKVIQKAFIEVNEDGTEAAAATVVGVLGCCAPGLRQPDPTIFRADQPFLVILLINGTYLKHNAMPLFAGRVTGDNVAEENKEKKEAFSVIEANGLFGKQFYDVLVCVRRVYYVVRRATDNIVCSPISAHAVLLMAYQGSEDATYVAFSKVLNMQNHEVAAAGYQSILKKLNNVSGVELSMANKIYFKNGYNLNSDFKEIIENKFQSALEQINFAKNQAALKVINKWVEKETKNKIKNLIIPDDLDKSTELILINAIYFKGKWASEFYPDCTRTQPFYTDYCDTIEVQMMEIHDKFNFKKDDILNVKILEMPYINEDFSIFLILPNDRIAVEQLESKIENFNLDKLIDGMYKAKVYVQIPKFKIEATIDLQDSLTELGLGIMFEKNKANFSKMFQLSQNCFGSKVIQKAFIEVNEAGTEAAAATDIGFPFFSGKVSVLENHEFLADHPFMVILKTCAISKDKPLPLFVGRVVKPEE